MRIEAYTQVQQMYSAKKAANVKSKSNVSRSDQVQISSIGKDIQNAKQAVAGASDIREDVIDHSFHKGLLLPHVMPP